MAHSEDGDSFQVPPLRGLVNDHAEIINPSVRIKLNQVLRSLKERSQGTEIAILTVPNLGGQSIEQASFAVVDAWGLGDKEKDNGVLLLVAQKEKRIRIEVGQGHEGNLTDAQAKRIIDETMVPLMRSSNPSDSILLGVFQIAQAVHPEIDLSPLLGAANMNVGRRRGTRGKGSPRWLGLLFFMVIAFTFGGRGGLLGFFLGPA